ncbi:unnamed protein product [Urochloa humidicola]
MASGEAEPLQYTTTVLRVSIHCEGCKKKVRKVLHNIEGVYKVTVDAAQHKVTVTGSLGADALIKRLHKAGKQAALWPVPAPAAVVEPPKKTEEVAPTPPAVPEVDKVKEVADKAEAKPKEAAKDKKPQPQPEAEGGKEKKPEKEKVGSDKKPEKAEAAKPKDEPKKDAEVTAPKEKSSSPVDPAAKESAAAAGGGEEPSSGGKKQGKKKKSKQKEGGEAEAAPAEKTPPQPSMPAPVAAAAAPLPGPERPLVGFPYYAAAQPVMSYNVAHPSSSVSYYAPTPVGPMPPPPPYGYPPYPAPMPEFMYGPPGMRSSPPQESYNNMFNEENANSCSVM